MYPEPLLPANIAVAYLVIVIPLLLFSELGFRLGRYANTVRNIERSPDIGTLVGASLGLLALLLGFTFAMATTRFELRQQLVVKEANAIGTAYLRAENLPEPQRGEAEGLLRRYVDLRLELVASYRDHDAFMGLVAETEQIQQRLWDLGGEVVATGQSPVVTSMFLQAINAVIDVHGERAAAIRNRVPTSIFVVSLIAAVLTMALTGYSSGLSGKRALVATTLSALVIALVMALVVDLHRPSEGTITVSQQSIADVRDWLARQGR